MAFEEGEAVVANRDGRQMTKGTEGIVHRVDCVDSEDYLFVRTEPNGIIIGPSSDNYWNKK